MTIALMDYPDMRIKPPNYQTQFCNYSYPREPELPSSQFFFLLAQKVSRDWKGTKPSQKKWPECTLTLIIPWDIFVFQ
jgi:hypothetical protein